jgi:hypothetical protein
MGGENVWHRSLSFSPPGASDAWLARARRSPTRGTPCGLFSCGQAHCGVIRRTALAHAQPAIIASLAGEGLASGTRSGIHSLSLMTSCRDDRYLHCARVPAWANVAANGEQLTGRSLGGLTPVTVRRLSRPGLAWRSAPRCRSRTAEQRFCPSAYVRKTRRALSQLRWRVRPGATYRCGACVGQGPDNAHGKSIIETKNAAGYGRVDTCDNGRLRRRTFAMSPLRSAIARCTSNAQRTASTTLANSAQQTVAGVLYGAAPVLLDFRIDQLPEVRP